MSDDFTKRIVRDIAVDLTDEFDKNFERQGFFGQKWKPKRLGKGSILIQTGALRRDIQRPTVSGTTITWHSDLPYSKIQNEGGKIMVTNRMKRFFWAMHKKTKSEAWKYMALMKVGSQIVIPKRQFLGWHNSLNKNVNAIVRHHVDRYLSDLAKRMNKK